jgi:sec-independent protein translocase protein TatA
MPSLGWQELIIVLIIVVIIFGAGKLPEIGGAMGKSIKEFKKEAEEPTSSLSDGTSATTVASTGAGSISKSVDATQVRADEI